MTSKQEYTVQAKTWYLNTNACTVNLTVVHFVIRISSIARIFILHKGKSV